jgi:hypothetical protein
MNLVDRLPRAIPNLKRLKPQLMPKRNDAESIPAKRGAIERGGETSTLIRQCLRVAESRGLNREQTYLLLACEALVRLGDLHRVHEDSEVTQRPQPRSGFDVDGHF